MTTRYYSQGGEDALLWAAFQDQAVGTFIDVGAFDGRYLSNSLSFEEQGWSGLCIEPHPRYFPLCQSNRPRSVCVHAACVKPGGPATSQFFSEPLGILSGIRANETLGMEARYASRNLVFPGFEPIEVPARTLDEIVAAAWPGVTSVDFISVDVEGTEIDVFHGCSLSARVIVAEANLESARADLFEHLAHRGYVFARAIHQNYFFACDVPTARRLEAASFDIRTEDVLHPLGEGATPRNQMGKRICLG